MAVRINSPEEFDSVFRGFGGLVLALFTGSVDGATGKSWCPDCVDAEPFIEQARKENSETAFLYCDVGPRESWRNQPGHPYRTNPITKVKCVPTLIRYQNGREIARLEEGRICNQEMLNEFFR